ncbi:PLP-dependent aminotransferase family protein [Frankia sp. CNm7]|uniref:PLP-dependent aminotransferase family protein n=1 Tax=Frankia nepalensis TaxID=1836974 RepID=A0A937URB7_9ACTN|nr:PLP-dependent aminotransferase family protein [Frankia nepalensis]MBL7495656.1 PLP-dependent aminotransferase family protein [Frankia nepalensis]MBL7510278.1 PLP-dependent aminotransferase family protein [Frankia nepalensis]MBL7520466.1 PLP-dependent aminotransferase family protein [Frankia nepalensis]MBL7631187.1 PLP-dependent aminotransferase family protein [Frankia nepalensis]
MDQSISAGRVAALVAGFDRAPAYAGLADALVLLIGDGRIPLGARLPSERDLTAALQVSRTTVARAYTALRDAGYATARQGAGTYAAVPGGRSRVHDRVLVPWAGEREMIDLNCAATSAPPEIAPAYADAVADLPAYLCGHGYFPAGLPDLQAAIARSYDRRGLPTDPEQIVVTPGALSAAALITRAFAARRDRVLVESPVYPNAAQALRDGGARLVEAPVDPDGWDLDAIRAVVRQTSPSLMFLVPDFQNPTGCVMTAAQRRTLAADLGHAGTVPVVDEAHQALALDGQEMPPPFAAFAPGALTIGSASKAFWGGLRVGWIRAPHACLERLTRARVALDLGVPVLEQLVVARLIAAGPVAAAHLPRLRTQRDALCAAVAAALPDWRFVRPAGGLALWCELPRPAGTALAKLAEERGVVVAPGPVFSVGGGLNRFVRIPWTRPPEELELAVARLADAWKSLADSTPPSSHPGRRVMVA